MSRLSYNAEMPRSSHFYNYMTSLLRFSYKIRFYLSSAKSSTTMEQTLLTTREQCLALLNDLQIPFKLHEHDPVMNLEEMKQKIKLEHAPFIKNLFYTDKKPNSYFFVIAREDTKLEKAFWKKVGTTSGNIRFAKDEQMDSVLKSKKGSINPFALANDVKQEIKAVVIDEKLFENEYWAFHPLENTATVELKRSDFMKFLETKKINHHKLALDETVVEEAPKEQPAKEKKEKGAPKEEVNLLGMETKKSENFSEWYQEIITKSGLIEYYEISGCYILRPWAYSIWEKIQAFFDALIKENGVENSYFPLFVSQRALNTEKDHVEGFAPEVAWVTKYGTSDLSEHIAIRPTSETIMYPAYSKWISSHRDLPLKLNQWTNVVRWEFKHPTPFIRTREFLWQEGHTAHATKEESDQETFANLEFYRKVYEELLAVPVRKGIKTESEKFAGGDFTSTVQTWIYENGRAIQAATSHNLGQNFAKMFNISFESEKKEKKLVYQTSWGLTTRSIGIMTMYHGDDKGLVLPPRIANIQAVIVPIPVKGKEELVLNKAKEIFTVVKKGGIRVHLDDKTNYNPGWKFNHWELKGVPVRIEIGPEDIKNEEVRVVIRVDGKKLQVKWADLVQKLGDLMVQIQDQMYQNAKAKFEERQKSADNWKDFMTHLNNRNVVLTPWCESKACEEKVKERSGIETKASAAEGEVNLTGQAKTLCVPLDAAIPAEGVKCFHCGDAAKKHVLWGRSY